MDLCITRVLVNKNVLTSKSSYIYQNLVSSASRTFGFDNCLILSFLFSDCFKGEHTRHSWVQLFQWLRISCEDEQCIREHFSFKSQVIMCTKISFIIRQRCSKHLSLSRLKHFSACKSSMSCFCINFLFSPSEISKFMEIPDKSGSDSWSVASGAILGSWLWISLRLSLTVWVLSEISSSDSSYRSEFPFVTLFALVWSIFVECESRPLWKVNVTEQMGRAD